MKNSRWRAAAAAFILLPASIVLWRQHDRGVRARRVAELKSLLEHAWRQPLELNQGALSMSEYDGLRALDRQPGISRLVYFNRYAEVRWSPDSTQITKELFEYALRYPLPDSIIDAHAVGLPIIRPLPGGTSYAIAVPLMERSFVQGLVFFEATDAALVSLLAQGDRLIPAPAPRPINSRGDSERSAQSQQAYLSGLIYFQRADDVRAKMKWRQAVSLDAGNEEAREGLRRLPASPVPSRF